MKIIIKKKNLNAAIDYLESKGWSIEGEEAKEEFSRAVSIACVDIKITK